MYICKVSLSYVTNLASVEEEACPVFSWLLTLLEPDRDADLIINNLFI